MTSIANDLKTESLIPLRDFLEGRSWPTARSIRWYIHFDKYEFETKCIRRIGRKIFVDVPAYHKWFQEQAK